MFQITAFYKFVTITNKVILQKQILQQCEAFEIKGTILLADEGINGTIAGIEDQLQAFWTWLRTIPYFIDLPYKASWAEQQPFLRLKVRVKKEIVTLGQPQADPSKHVGQYVKPADWNALISDPETIVIDTRNDYETRIGSFTHAVDPHTKTFRDFPDFVRQQLADQKHKKIAMFCTGGIRCEKASSFMLQEGFPEVYHLEGGILQYLEDVDQQDSLWQGECFVFDKRVTVDHQLAQGSHQLCYACQQPLDPCDLASPHYEKGISCPRCYDQLTPKQKQRAAQRQHQIQLAQLHGQPHLGRRNKKLSENIK